MSIPAPITTHTNIALGKLISQFAQNKPVFHGILKSMVNRLQDIENMIWQVIYQRQLSPAPGQTVSAAGVQLDTIGRFLGLPRNGLLDVAYVTALKTQILVNASEGRVDDFNRILTSVLGSPAAYSVTEEYYNVTNALAYNITTSQAFTLLQAFAKARAAGCRAVLRYTTIPSTQIFMWGDSHTGTATGGQGGFGDASTGTLTGGGLPISTQG